MSIGLKTNDRNVIPRWRDSAIAATTGELKALNRPGLVPTSTSGELTGRINDWRKHGTPAFAADLVATGLVLDARRNNDVLEAAYYILASTDDHPYSVKSLASVVANVPNMNLSVTMVDQPDDDELRSVSRKQIRNMKSRLRSHPRNGLAWVDMARHYAMLGASKQALRSMKIGVTLAPHNRFVLRSAARLYVHLDDAEQAYELLRRDPATASDPWLRAAEIATAGVMNKTPRKLGATKKALRAGSLDSSHVSELASAVATLEMANGSFKSARRLFNLGLQHATENAVAQAEWASKVKKLTGILLNDDHFRLPRTFEAKVIGHLEKLEPSKCVLECVRWLEDEPFSSRPVEVSSAISIIGLEDYTNAIDTARRGLVSNPDHFTLRNNLSVALAEIGKVDEADIEYSKIKTITLDEWTKAISLATKGLLAFRRQRYEEGRYLYREAAGLARSGADNDSESMVLIHWAREEFKAGDVSRAGEIAEQSIHTAGGQPGPVLQMALSRFQNLKARD